MNTRRKPKAAKPEMTGFRGEDLSQWHRTLGFDFPAVDIDFLLLEYDSGFPCALVEYKQLHGKPIVKSHPSFQALRSLCEPAKIPFFVVRYKLDEREKTFIVYPMNTYAWAHCADTRRIMGETEFVRLLGKLRDKKVPS